MNGRNSEAGLQSEQDFLHLIDAYFPREHRSVALGRGDDCAVLSCPPCLCLSTDLFLEDVHFRRRYFSPGDIGYKGLAVNVSDIAAMGGRPLGFSLGLMIPPDLDATFFAPFFKSMSRLCADLDLSLTGGDLSRADRLGLSVTIWGEPPAGGNFLTRQGCTPGDMLAFCGPVGLARTGLLVLEEYGNPARFPRAVQHFFRPPILVDQGMQLAGSNRVKAMMDVSDGLATDLPRLLGSLGMEVTMTESDLDPEVVQAARDRSADPVEFALLGGEDYALLFALSETDLDRVRKEVDFTILGRVTSDPLFRRHGRPMNLRGFDHFHGKRS